MQFTINSFRQLFPDKMFPWPLVKYISLTAVKFPDISRFFQKSGHPVPFFKNPVLVLKVLRLSLKPGQATPGNASKDLPKYWSLHLRYNSNSKCMQKLMPGMMIWLTKRKSSPPLPLFQITEATTTCAHKHRAIPTQLQQPFTPGTSIFGETFLSSWEFKFLGTPSSLNAKIHMVAGHYSNGRFCDGYLLLVSTTVFALLCNECNKISMSHQICWISQKWYEIHSYNETLIGTQQFHFERHWMTLRNIQWHEVSPVSLRQLSFLFCNANIHAVLITLTYVCHSQWFWQWCQWLSGKILTMMTQIQVWCPLALNFFIFFLTTYTLVFIVICSLFSSMFVLF